MAGANPSFGESHLIRALLEISGGRASRNKLVERLGVGEGSVRTILKRLADNGLVSSTNAGHSLTDAGEKQVSSHLEKFSKPDVFSANDMILGGENAFIIVKGASDKLSASALAERDTALKAGADTAVILVVRDGRIQFPSGGVDVEDYPETLKELENKELGDGDVVVIASSSRMPKSQDALIEVALKICA
ncbi:MAG TPA: DUF4443 domain-containing protein [Candidatus Altiarchaeales archaeon]|nr:DUF4443 domain-containing protein [Candidatus Altiarchaeales archaeon]